MFAEKPQKQSKFQGAITLIELIFFTTARESRKGHGNALMALAMQILQTVIFVAAFYVMFSLLGLRAGAIRGDFILYIMSGVFLFMTHIKAVGAVVGAEGPSSAMMKHAPMNTVIAIAASALSSLYISTLSLFLVFFAVHVAWHPIVIYDPVGAAGMYLLAWFSGVALGLPLYALKPWMPNLTSIINTVYSRVNMIASGKMFVVNLMPPRMRSMFDWNPLFHIIDQSRGYVFVNYTPMHTNWEYAMTIAIIALVVGLMAEFYTRSRASLSWSAGR